MTKRFDYLGLTHIVAKQSGDRGVQSVQSRRSARQPEAPGMSACSSGSWLAWPRLRWKYYDPVDLDYARAGMTEIHEDAALMPIVAGATAGRAGVAS